MTRPCPCCRGPRRQWFHVAALRANAHQERHVAHGLAHISNHLQAPARPTTRLMLLAFH